MRTGWRQAAIDGAEAVYRGEHCMSAYDAVQLPGGRGRVDAGRCGIVRRPGGSLLDRRTELEVVLTPDVDDWALVGKGMQNRVLKHRMRSDVVVRGSQEGFADICDLVSICEMDTVAALSSGFGWFGTVRPAGFLWVEGGERFIEYQEIRMNSLHGSPAPSNARKRQQRGMAQARGAFHQLDPGIVRQLRRDQTRQSAYAATPGNENPHPLPLLPGSEDDYPSIAIAHMYRMARIAHRRFGTGTLHDLGMFTPGELKELLKGRLPDSFPRPGPDAVGHGDLKPANIGWSGWLPTAIDLDLIFVASEVHAAAHDLAILARRGDFRNRQLPAYVISTWRANVPGAAEAIDSGLVEAYGFLEDARSMYTDLLRATQKNEDGTWRLSPDAVYLTVSAFRGSLGLPPVRYEQIIDTVEHLRREATPEDLRPIPMPALLATREKQANMDVYFDNLRAIHPHFAPDILWLPEFAPVERYLQAREQYPDKMIVMGMLYLGDATVIPSPEHPLARAPEYENPSADRMLGRVTWEPRGNQRGHPVALHEDIRLAVNRAARERSSGGRDLDGLGKNRTMRR